ncbi:MAG: hypothetical protein ACFBSG_05895 [Leptolyngbyaceae cyanobacterium]
MPTDSENIIALGPISVALSNFKISDTAVPAGSQSIIQKPNNLELSVEVEFSPCPSPFTNFLLGLGLEIEVLFHVEGFGPAPEVDLGPATVTTNGTDCSYTVSLNSPSTSLTAGVYKAAAVVTVKGGGVPFATGYISDIVFQVY